MAKQEETRIKAFQPRVGMILIQIAEIDWPGNCFIGFNEVVPDYGIVHAVENLGDETESITVKLETSCIVLDHCDNCLTYSKETSPVSEVWKDWRQITTRISIVDRDFELYYDKEWLEWTVRVFIDSELDVDKTYYADSLADAVQTRVAMIKQYLKLLRREEIEVKWSNYKEVTSALKEHFGKNTYTKEKANYVYVHIFDAINLLEENSRHLLPVWVGSKNP